MESDMEMQPNSTPKIVIVGAGFAGASTAWWLRHYGEKDVLILEREPAAGLKSSGQNAAMARQATNDPFISRLLVEGVRFMAAPPKGFSRRPILRRAGSALMGSEAQVQKMAAVLKSVLPGDEFRIGSVNDIGPIPYLANVRAPAVLLTRTDGFIDLESLLAGFLSEAGVLTSCAWISANREPDGWSLATSRGKIRCSILVIASGANASACAGSAGAGAIPLRPTTRHLFQSESRNEFLREAPFVWDIAAECYARPDGSGRLLLSACDQDPYDPATALLPDARMPAILREKLSRAFPSLARVRFHRYWPGTRTLTSDGRFVIGPDPKIETLFWVAGLGGHGVTTAPAVGRIAAESILGLKSPPQELSCGRFFQAW